MRQNSLQTARYAVDQPRLFDFQPNPAKSSVSLAASEVSAKTFRAARSSRLYDCFTKTTIHLSTCFQFESNFVSYGQRKVNDAIAARRNMLPPHPEPGFVGHEPN